MKKTIVQLEKKDIAGLEIRTNNANEMSPQTGKIGPLVARYRLENLANQIPHSKHPGVTFCVYSNYQNKERGEDGDYNFLIGEEVHEIEEVPNGFKLLTLPSGKYAKFTTPVGKIPDIIITAWQQIWKMSPEELGGKRNYVADFEVYDKRAVDPEHAVLDIYIGLKS